MPTTAIVAVTNHCHICWWCYHQLLLLCIAIAANHHHPTPTARENADAINA
jgi:hypothetical protein